MYSMDILKMVLEKFHGIPNKKVACRRQAMQRVITDKGIENEGNIMKELKQLMKELNDMIQDLDSGVKQNGDKLDQIIDNQGISDNFEYTT